MDPGILPPPPPSALGSAGDAPAGKVRSTRPAQVGWTTAGLVGLFLLVLVAHGTEVAFDCTLYGIYAPDGTAGACPVLSWPTLVVLSGFAIPSAMVAFGLSENLILLVSPTDVRPSQRRETADSRRLALEFTAPFLAFFGWGVLAW